MRDALISESGGSNTLRLAGEESINCFDNLGWNYPCHRGNLQYRAPAGCKRKPHPIYSPLITDFIEKVCSGRQFRCALCEHRSECFPQVECDRLFFGSNSLSVYLGRAQTSMTE